MKYEDVSAILYRNHGVFDITTPFGTQRRRLFLSTESKVCEFAKRSRRRGYPIQPNEIKCWLSISKVTKPTTNIVAKFQRYASRATFPSAFVRKCLEADPTKDCYENRLTTGTRIDGEIISLDAISRYNHWAVGQFRKALKERRNFNSGTFTFRGYDGSLWIEVKQKDDNYNYYKAGDIAAGFSKEYRGCANGYYYALINDEHFIGIDID